MIVDERMVTFINSLDEGHTEFLEQLEKEAREDAVPIVRREMQSFLKFLMAAARPKRILEVGTAVGLSLIHILPDQLPEQIKKERSRVLIALGQEHQREYMEQFFGKKKEVLFEEQQKIQGQTYWTGHTMEYLKVAVISEESLENKRVMVQLQNIIGQDLILAE